eukprot:CAMPEP_0172806108 /NCGR_PEP_ID=MMETSP1075-20121228/6134_1 /TAXON_ID=2916 /ORGANISM="Ceratium fusus, Strain PA161109" /LENGTH=153 /DNA_ID=CAMNT_0013644845 /DNA_START=90 /DNA_END=547 /DNA_ORIENTATION=+
MTHGQLEKSLLYKHFPSTTKEALLLVLPRQHQNQWQCCDARSVCGNGQATSWCVIGSTLPAVPVADPAFALALELTCSANAAMRPMNFRSSLGLLRMKLGTCIASMLQPKGSAKICSITMLTCFLYLMRLLNDGRSFGFELPSSLAAGACCWR